MTNESPVLNNAILLLCYGARQELGQQSTAVPSPRGPTQWATCGIRVWDSEGPSTALPASVKK